MVKSINPVSVEYLREHFSYAPDTGILSRIKSVRSDMLGIQKKHTVKIGEFEISKARVIWAIHYGYWPEKLIDHVNRDRNDNTLVNLREATHTQNQYNKVQTNTHGYKGVTWRDRQRKPWLAKIRVNGTRLNLGSFATREEAAQAYAEACVKYHGEFAQLGVK